MSGLIIILYIGGICVGLRLVWWLTAKIGIADAKLSHHLVRIVLRSMSLAVAFAPVPVVAGYVAFVLPAFLTLASWLLSPSQTRLNYEIQEQIRWSIQSLLICWLLFSGIYAIIFSLRAQRQALQSKTNGNPRTGLRLIFWIGLLVIAALVTTLVVTLVSGSSQHN